jgi:chromosome segregation ATPase
MSEGNTAMSVSPFNPEDRETTKTFFQGIADTIVDASELRKTVQAMREELDGLRKDIEKVRHDNAAMDAEIYDLRHQRDTLRSESAEKGRRIGELELENANLSRRNEHLAERVQELEMNISSIGQELSDTRMVRDDAQLRVMELEETLRSVETDRERWYNKAAECQTKLDTLRSIFTEPTQSKTPDGDIQF